MKIQNLLALLATLAIGLTSAARAEEDTPLSKQMSAMNKSLRTLKRQIADPAKKDDNLALLAKIKDSLAESLKLQPAKTKDIPEAEKAAYVEKYKAQLTELGKTFDGIAAAITAGKPDDAKPLLEKLGEQKEKGHKDFGADDDK